MTNPGLSPLVVDVGRAGFSLDLRGRPRVASRVDRASAASWLSVQPWPLRAPAGAGRSLTVSSRLPARAEPGDHDALVLLTTRPQRGAGVAVRMRIGVVVVVRAPGPDRAPACAGRAARTALGAAGVLELGVANRGNVTETLDRARLQVWIDRGSGRARLRHEVRDLRPRTNGVVQVPYRGRLRAWTTVRVELIGEPGRPPVIQTFRVKL